MNDIDATLPFYANYFHPISLEEELNLFNKEHHDSIKLKSPVVEDKMEPFEQGGVFKLDGESELLIPLRGLLVLPNNASANKVPLVLIGHGQHEAFRETTNNEILSYKGYQVLQKHLAKHGIASYSINLNIVNLLDKYNENSTFKLLALDSNQRLLLFFLHLMLLKIIAGEPVSIPANDEYPIKFNTNTGLKRLDKALADSTSSTDDEALKELKKLRVDLAGKIDFEKLGLMGHSRGADAVSRISSYFYKKDGTSPGPTYPVNSEVDSRIKRIAKYICKPQQDFIKCIVALEPASTKDPEDTKITSKHGYVIDNDQTMYFAVAGTHDQDVTLDSIRIYEYPVCPKAMIAIKGATHKRFNYVWRRNSKEENCNDENDNARADKHRFLTNCQHDMISKCIFAHFFIASLTVNRLFYYTFTYTLPVPIAPGIDFQSAWEFGFPFRDSPESPEVLKKLDDKIVGVPAKQLKGKDYNFEQEEVKAFYIEKDNSGSSTIEIPIDPNNSDDNLSKYTHFSFRFAKGYDLETDPSREENKNFTVQLFEITSPIGKLIAGKDIKTIKLRAYQAFDEEFEKKVDENGKRKHVFEPSILLQTVEIELSRFKVSDLKRVNRIEITVIPDKTKLPPFSTKKRISGSIGGAFLGAFLGSTGVLIASNIEEEIQGKTNEIASYAAAGGFIIGSLLFFLVLAPDKNAFVFKDFLLTNRKISLTS